MVLFHCSLLESGEESDFSVLFDDDAVHLHSCLIQARSVI